MSTAQKDFQHQAGNAAERAKDVASQAANKAKDVGTEMANKASDAASYVGNKAGEAASFVGNKAGEAASFVGNKAGDAASFVGKKADEATSAVGAGMKNLAGSIRGNAPEKGVVGAAGSAVADTLESSGKYLQQQGLSGIGEDLTNMIRRNPIPAILLCVGVGYLIAKATSSRS